MAPILASESGEEKTTNTPRCRLTGNRTIEGKDVRCLTLVDGEEGVYLSVTSDETLHLYLNKRQVALLNFQSSKALLTWGDNLD